MKGDEVAAFIQAYTEEHGWAPSYREIGEGCQIKSTSNVGYWIEKLEQDGRLVRESHKARTIRIV